MKRMLLLCLALGVVGAEIADAQAVAPKVSNGQLDSRPARSGLARTVDTLAASTAPAWLGYVVDAIPGDRGNCDDCGPGACGTVYLEGRRHVPDSPAQAPRPIAVLLRVEGGSVQKIRTHSADCELDAGGLPVHWLTDVDAADSVAMLGRFVKIADKAARATTLSWNSALTAVALHATPAAIRSLEQFAAGGQPLDIRKRAAFWLGSTRGAEGFATVRRLAETDPDDGFRKEVTFALSVSHEPGALDALIRMAKNDANSAVRKQAIFWLGQKAGDKVAGTLADSARNDPETAIKERAVFALSRLPNGEGVDKLIEVARSNSDPVVRKRAVFWLGQSNEPKALAYLLEILRK
jgi:hypothetical protein